MNITINNPFIKDKKNIAWLESNWESFLDYMAKHHSLADCWHTILDLTTFNDKYVAGLIKNVEANDKRKKMQDEARIAALPKEIKKKSKIEKKNSIVEEAYNEKKAIQDAEDDLLD